MSKRRGSIFMPTLTYMNWLFSVKYDSIFLVAGLEGLMRLELWLIMENKYRKVLQEKEPTQCQYLWYENADLCLMVVCNDNTQGFRIFWQKKEQLLPFSEIPLSLLRKVLQTEAGWRSAEMNRLKSVQDQNKATNWVHHYGNTHSVNFSRTNREAYPWHKHKW